MTNEISKVFQLTDEEFEKYSAQKTNKTKQTISITDYVQMRIDENNRKLDAERAKKEIEFASTLLEEVNKLPDFITVEADMILPEVNKATIQKFAPRSDMTDMELESWGLTRADVVNLKIGR